MHYCECGYNYNILILFRLPIPICLGFYTAEMCSCDYKFILFKVHFHMWYFLLKYHSVWNKPGNIISHCCWICCTNVIILTYMYQWCCIVTNFIKDNLMNLIEVFNRCGFVVKVDFVTFFVGAQYRTMCVLHNSLVVWLFNEWYTKVPGIFHNGGTCHIFTNYL